MAKPRVLALATTFPRSHDDTTPRFVLELSERLTSHYAMTILAPHHPGAKKQEIMGSLDVHRFAYFKPESLQKLCYDGGIIPNMRKSVLAKIQMPFLIVSEFFSALSLARKSKSQLIHAHWILPQGMVGVWIKKITGIPLLVTIHGSDLFPLKSPLFLKLQRMVVKNADMITVNSLATQGELFKRFPEAEKKTVLIPMGVNIAHFKPRKVSPTKDFKDKKILLYVGRLSDQKGVQYLIEALPEVQKKHKDAILLIIGDGPYKPTLEEVAYENKVSSIVKFLGALSQEEIAYYYNLCDVFVLPALSNETGTEALGLALLEAMASGCAVIGSNVGGIPSAIIDNKNGLLVEQKDPQALSKAIDSLLSHPLKANLLGRNAASSAQSKYSWESISKRFLKAYAKVLR